MSEIFHVAFNMPSWIRAGLDNKTYEVIGGVVRRVGSKEVVAWLRPATNAAGEMAEVGPNLGLLSGGAALTVPVVAAAAVVIVVVAVGFTIVLKKLETIERQLDEVMIHLRDIKEDVAWLKQAEWAKQRAAVKAALLGSADAERDGRYDDLRFHITTFRETQHFFLEQLRAMAALQAPLKSSAAFVDVARMFVAVSQAKGWAMTLATGADIAKEELSRDANAYSEIRATFMMSLDRPEDNLEHLLSLTPAHWDGAKTTLSALPRADAAAYFQIEGFEFTRENHAQLRSLSAPGPNKPCAMIIVGGAAPLGWTPEMV